MHNLVLTHLRYITTLKLPYAPSLWNHHLGVWSLNDLK